MSEPGTRVLHVISPQPPGETGGVDRHVRELILAQAAAGGIRPQVVELGAKGFAATLAADGITAHTLAEPYRLSVFRELAELLRRQAINVVHTHGYDADLIGIGGWLFSGRRAVLVATVHGLIWRPAGNLLKTLAMLASLRLAAAAVIATSSRRAGWLRRWLPDCEVRFVANGVAELPARAGPVAGAGPGRPRLLYVGRLSPEKRVDLVLATCAALVPTLPDVSCRIVGSGNDEALLRALAEQKGLAPRVQFVGLRDDIGPELHGGDVLLLLSDTEGTPRVIVEAMAVGLPIVASDVGGVGDLVRHEREALLVPPGDSQAAAAAVLRLVREPGLATRLSLTADGRYRAELTMTAMEGQVAALYGRLMKKTFSAP